MNTIGVESIEDTLEKIENAGGRIMQPKMAIPGVGWFAAFTDPEGNNWGLMEDDPGAR